MENQMYTWGYWTDSNGNVNRMRYKTEWNGHKFTDEEQKRLLAGDEITFIDTKGQSVTGHFQYFVYKGDERFGFVSNYFRNDYVLRPIYHGLSQRSTFKLDLQRDEIMTEYMGLYYYAKLQNKDRTQVLDYQRITDIEEQKKGIDVTYTRDGKKLLIDEKAQMDYIYADRPLLTFALELLNSSSGAIGWFVNSELKTQYYMFIWPHANRGPLTVEKRKNNPLAIDDIEYVYYALVNKPKLQMEIDKKLNKNPKRLLEYARNLAQLKLEGAEKVLDKDGKCIGYRYKKDGFNDDGYLYYTLGKYEQPVNLVVARDWLYKIAEESGTISSDKEGIR